MVTDTSLSTQVIQQLVNGLALGGIYALIALGYTMVYGIVKLINFAHGEVLMVGAYAGYFILGALGTNAQGIVTVTPLSLTAAFMGSMVFAALLGVGVERGFYKPLRSAPRINALITAIGISLFLQNFMKALPFVGPNPREFPHMSMGNLELGGIGIPNLKILVFGVSLALMAGLTWLVDFTKVGKAMRAVSFDKGAASLMGISVDRIISVTFAVGSALAAAGGMLYATSYPQIDPYMGLMPGLKAFVAAVLGGIGSIPGAMIGGVILGVAETLTKGFISTQLSDAVVFTILILVLLIKPTGIMGRNQKEKV